MYNNIIALFATIGVLVTLLFLCKFVFLFVLYLKHGEKFCCVKRCSEFSENVEHSWFLIPTIAVSKTNKYIEINARWLLWELYTNYCLSNEV